MTTTIKAQRCLYCDEPVTWDAERGRWSTDSTYRGTSADASADMSTQCGLSASGRHFPNRGNRNHVLDLMRDGDFADPWGTAMGWAGAACDVLYDADANSVPPSLGYSPGIAGPEVPSNGDGNPDHRITLADLSSYETVTIYCWLHQLDVDPDWADPDTLPYWDDPTFAARAEELRVACLCLSRYLDWCKRAGLDY